MVSKLRIFSVFLLLGLLNVAYGAEEPVPANNGLATATFAGGCFWCVEHAFDEVAGVVSTTSGYTGGQKKDPSYEEVSSGGTGHTEAVQVVYDPKKIGYENLLSVFWRNIDPLDAKGQFCDKGSQYRSAIFYHSPEQKRLAEQAKQALDKSKRLKQPIVTEISPASTFYAAEEYHQNFHQKNPIRYKFYRAGCGRDNRLEEIWGDSTSG